MLFTVILIFLFASDSNNIKSHKNITKNNSRPNTATYLLSLFEDVVECDEQEDEADQHHVVDNVSRAFEPQMVAGRVPEHGGWNTCTQRGES